jgi:hypothetical protein
MKRIISMKYSIIKSKKILIYIKSYLLLTGFDGLLEVLEKSELDEGLEKVLDEFVDEYEGI